MLNDLSKEKKEQIIAIGIGLVVLIIALWMLVIGPQGKKLVERKGQIAQKSEELQAAETLVANAGKIGEQLGEKEKELGNVESKMASGDLYFWMNEKLEGFQRKYGYDVRIPNVEREQKINVGIYPDFAYGAVKYTVSGDALYHELGKFLATFENENAHIRVQDLDISPYIGLGEEKSSGDKLIFKMDIVALRKPVEDSE